MATTPTDNLVIEKMLGYLSHSGDFGNPTSTHQYGVKAAAAVMQARLQVANLINATAEEIIWTSGATESDNLAIKGAARFYSRKGKHIITLKTEHKAVLDSCHQLAREGFEISYLTPQANGLLCLASLQAAIRADTILVSVMHVNNEIGVVQDIAAIAALTRSQGIIFHVDAAQSAGKIPIDVASCQVDLLSLSAHKIYGPKGIGALYVRRNPRVRLEALIHGGGHELGLRSGTLPTHQIVGMGAAFELAHTNLTPESARILALRQHLWQNLALLAGIQLNGDLTCRVPGNLNVSFAGIDGDSLLLALKDLAVSTASACTAASIEPSYVLRALGINDALAHSALRISIGRYTTLAEIDFAIATITQQVQRLRQLSPL